MISTKTLFIIILLSLVLGFVRLNSERTGIDSEGLSGQKFSYSKSLWKRAEAMAIFKKRCTNSDSITEEECSTKTTEFLKCLTRNESEFIEKYETAVSACFLELQVR